MKILQISTFVPYPPTDGGKLSVYGLIKSLSERGHEIELICYRKHDDYDISYNALRQFCKPHILDFKTDNSVIGAIPNFFSLIPYNASKYYSKLILNYTKNLLTEKNFDIIQLNHLHLGWLVKHLKNVTDIPIVMRSQNIETMIMKRYSEQVRNPLLKLFSWLQYKKLIRYEPQIYLKSDLCIMISDNDCDYLKSKSPGINAISIPAGVDEKLFAYKKKSTIPHSIAHIGHTDWFPNFDSLNWFITEIFPRILERYSDAKLYVYGGGKTKFFPVEKKLRNNVKIVGFVEDLWDSLSEIQLTVVPLRIGGGIRIKILELLATGNFIISSSIGKEGINVEDGKQLLIADTTDEFVNKIIQVFDGYLTSMITLNGRKFIKENYTWDIIAKRFENSYLKLMGSKSS